MENYVNQQWENKKNMSKINSKCLATLRQKLRKYTKDFDEELAKYRDNPELLDDEDDDLDEKLETRDDSESESEDQKKEKKPTKKPSKKVKVCIELTSI